MRYKGNNREIVRNTEMGIYSSGRIFGISIRLEREGSIRFEKTFSREMTANDIKEVYNMYIALDTNDCSFYIYTECSTTHERESKEDMYWMPTTRTFIESLANRALNSG